MLGYPTGVVETMASDNTTMAIRIASHDTRELEHRETEIVKTRYQGVGVAEMNDNSPEISGCTRILLARVCVYVPVSKFRIVEMQL